MENIKDYSDFYRLEVHFDDYPYKAFNEVISIYYRTMDDLKSYLNHILKHSFADILIQFLLDY